jgi:ribosome-associated heat shock protein Hsp15
MRLDNFVSDLGIIKRRTVAKEMIEGGHIKINGERVKPAHKVKAGDLIAITGKVELEFRVIKIPEGKSVPRAERAAYFELLTQSPGGFEL